MKVCVFGASGYVGASIYEKIKQRQELEVIGTYLEEAVFSNLVRLDVNEAEDFSRFFKKERPDIVIWSVMSGPEEGRVSDQGDRKSTRLNSSHVSISYAVFCLKKKN